MSYFPAARAGTGAAPALMVIAMPPATTRSAVLDATCDPVDTCTTSPARLTSIASRCVPFASRHSTCTMPENGCAAA